MNPIRTIFFGTPTFAIAPLQFLWNDGRYQIISIVSQNDKPIGRKQVITKSPVSLLAEKMNIPLFTPSSLRTEENIEWMQEQHPDIGIVVAYGKIIPLQLLSVPLYGFINIHGSLLPKLRGASPIQQAILEGDKETGITIMQMNQKMDEGDIIAQKKIGITLEDTYETLAQKLSLLGAEEIANVVYRFVQGELSHTPQNHPEATYCSLITKEMGKVIWAQDTAEQIERKLRAFTPWPGIFTIYSGKRLKILEVSTENLNAPLPLGSLVEQRGIQTKDGILIPALVQPEGKKPMSFEDFIRGQQGKTIVFS